MYFFFTDIHFNKIQHKWSNFKICTPKSIRMLCTHLNVSYIIIFFSCSPTSQHLLMLFIKSSDVKSSVKIRRDWLTYTTLYIHNTLYSYTISLVQFSRRFTKMFANFPAILFVTWCFQWISFVASRKKKCNEILKNRKKKLNGTTYIH